MNKDRYNEILHGATNSTVRYFNKNESYGLLRDVMSGRAGNMKTLEISQYYRKDAVIRQKNFYYENLRKYALYVIPLKTIGFYDRDKYEILKDLRYRKITLDELNKTFNDTIDLYEGGNKVPRNEIRIVLFDDVLVISIPREYRKASGLYLTIRPYLKDFTLDSTQPYVVLGDKEQFMNEYECLGFINGVKCNVSKIQLDKTHTKYQFFVDDNTKTIELIFIKGLVKLDKTIHNKHLEISDKFKLPIPTENIIAFNNNRFIHFDMQPCSKYLYKLDTSVDMNNVEFYAVYIDDIYDEKYYDDMTWHFNYDRKNIDIFSKSPSQSPEFARKFKLTELKGTPTNYIDRKKNIKDYKDYETYQHDVLCDMINFDKKMYNKYIDNVECGYGITSDWVHLNIKDCDLNALSRRNTFKEHEESKDENENNKLNFPTEMILFKIPNQNKYLFLVYLDGIKLTTYCHMYNAPNGFTYLYIPKSKFISKLKVKFIDIEIFNTTLDKPKSTNIVLNGDVITIDGKDLLQTKDDKDYIIVKDMITGKFFDTSTKYTKTDLDAMKFNLKFENPHKTYTIVNSNVLMKYEYKITRRGVKGVICRTDMFNKLPQDKDRIRVYKSGKLLPRKFYNLKFEGDELFISIPDCKFTLYEIVEVYYTPCAYLEVYGEDTVCDLAKIVPTIQKLVYPFNRHVGSYFLNGRLLNEETGVIWCNSGMQLIDARSRKYFTALFRKDKYYEIINEYLEHTYHEGRDLFNEYVQTLFKGNFIDDEKEKEPDITDEDKQRKGDLYYDLYDEFLKHNIISLTDPVPRYIEFKYHDLVDDRVNAILIDTSEEMNYYMPLDVSLRYPDESFKNILDFYYKLITDSLDVQYYKYDNIPDDVKKYYGDLLKPNNIIDTNKNEK